MSLAVEVGVGYLCKEGEELCGDRVEVMKTPYSTIVILSDGLGSGVKANILATLSVKIAAGLVRRKIPIDHVLETVAKTLPVCKVRGVAYSTLAILEVYKNGLAHLVEWDTPPALLWRNGLVAPLETAVRQVGEKAVRESHFRLREGDSLILVSDGVIHAGIGGLLKVGLGIEGLAAQLRNENLAKQAAQETAGNIINLCAGYYLGKPGDDTTAVVVKTRSPRFLTVFTGPPRDPANDEEVVYKLVNAVGRKVICGGTTGNIASRVLQKPLTVNLQYMAPGIPPTANLAGIDLVTEGILTMNSAVACLQSVQAGRPLLKQEDGATMLARELLHADAVKLLVGTAVNPAHQSNLLPSSLSIRAQTVEKLIAVLQHLGKEVAVEWY